MNLRNLTLSLLVFVLVACGQPTPRPDTTAQAAFETYVAALNAGDTEAAADFYDTQDGFHWIERGGIQYDSGADAAASLRALQSSGGGSKMTLDNLRIAPLSTNSALLSTHFEFTMLTESGEPQFSFTGWMTVGMVYRADGWKIAGGQTGPGEPE